MENTIDLTVILPIKSAVVRDFDEYFNKAINSCKEQEIPFKELIIVHTPEEQLVNILNSYDFGELNVRKIEFTGTPSYASQVNKGIQESTTKWVSLLEFDDEYSSIWFKNVKRYTDVYDDVDAFLPIVVDVDSKGTFAGFTNEATFAANFTQEIGILTNDTLLDYQNFQSAGMVANREKLIECGLIKESFKLTFVYELLLRMTYHSFKIMTIPRIGYKHTNLREGSIFWNYKNGSDKITDTEVKFWIDSAKKEHFFSEDRGIKYEENVV
jgi:hypothetical protein